ncbi:PAS domain S-box protein [Kovacikia minuta CCNUW1]|uniref:PAS domain-containing protein n=1 Tax=Kovacikia minuta TaxID=2931930 RepID=UPI001CCD177F|nr:PAS domain S-box protein [Kovacikia minuta]UBF24483.1 PAS domain S-box protein [Kovacikia minuta CCNUW1]
MDSSSASRDRLNAESVDLQTRMAALESELQQCKLELQQEKAARQDSETRLNAILNRAIASITSFRMYADCHWEYDYYSAGCEAIFGYTAQELTTNQYLWWSRVLPQDQQSVIIPSWANIFAEKVSHREYRFFHKNGSLRWISSTVTSQRDEAEDCWRVTTVDMDISDRKQAEETLRRSEEKLSKIFHNSPAPIAVVTFSEGRFLEVNECFLELTGYSRQEVIGHTVFDLGLLVDVEQASQRIHQLQQRQPLQLQEIDYRTKAGEIRTALSSVDTIEIDGQLCALSISKDHYRSQTGRSRSA